MEKKYADIIIDISHEKVDKTFQYIVPQRLREKLEIGMAVHVPFGRGNHIREGYVLDLTDTPQYSPQRLKEIADIMPDAVRAQSRSIRLASWMKNRYGSTMIAAMKTVLPVKQSVKGVQTRMVSLMIPRDQALELVCQAQRKKQVGKVRLLEALLDGAKVSYTMLTTKLAISPQTIRSMCEQCVIRMETFESYRNPIQFEAGVRCALQPNAEQQKIVDDFLADYDRGNLQPALLHGITGSGKTEVYMQLIQGMLDRGKESIVLIPEIALTYQTVLRFYMRFGDIVSLVNSRLSQGEKYDQFRRAQKGEVKIMIGPRSALFTPFQNPGLIIIDEEHETSYKSDQMPKYHARETAVFLAGMCGARVFMGSATPSLDAFYMAEQGVYKKYTLTERIRGNGLPAVHIVDLREELKEGNTSIFSRRLREAMEDRLARRQQIMLFLNRRGIAGFISCRACGHVVKCPHCDVSLSEHRSRLVCHYCGYQRAKLKNCPVCGSPYIYGFKAGTQQVEDKVREMFPAARVLRMDADTTKRKDSHEKILAAFANEEADILIGTQMIVKGHDFKNVTLVGVLAADMSLFSSDYRAAERTFQLLVQAVGRAGRGSAEGEAVIQTYQPQHYALQRAAQQDYEGFYREEIAYRALLDYPPVWHMLGILLLSRQEAQADFFADRYAQLIREYFQTQCCDETQVRLIGPAPDAIGKINDVYRRILYVKCVRESMLADCRRMLEEYAAAHEDEMKNISVFFDVE